MSRREDDYNSLYKFFSTTTLPPWPGQPRQEKEIELDDTAPLPLLIGIGLALFIGFVILVLICCCCRRRRPSPNSSSTTSTTAPPHSQASYQRAPLVDGGGGIAYQMTSVPPQNSFPKAPLPGTGFQPGSTHFVPGMQRDYGMIGSGLTYTGGANTPQFPQQPTPHFGGLPVLPPNHQYLPQLGVGVGGPGGPLHQPPYQSPPLHGNRAASVSHSSQASTSSVSGATVDPLVPPSSIASSVPGFSQQHQQNFQHQYMIQQHQQYMMPPTSQLSQQQFLQQQQQHYIMSGRDSPAVFNSYSHVNNNANNPNTYLNHPAQSMPSAPPMQSQPPSSSIPRQQSPPPSLPSSTSHDAMSGSLHADKLHSPSSPSVAMIPPSNSSNILEENSSSQAFLTSDSDALRSHTEDEEEEE